MRRQFLRRLFTRNKMTLVAFVIGSAGAFQAGDYFYVAQNLQRRIDPTVTMTARPLHTIHGGKTETIALTVRNSGGPIAGFGFDLYPNAKGGHFTATHSDLRLPRGCTLDTSDSDFDRLACRILNPGQQTFLLKGNPASSGTYTVVPDGHRGTARAALVTVHRNTSGLAAVVTDRTLK